MHTYRIWFQDETAILIDDETQIAAKRQADALKLPGSGRITQVEELN